MTPQHTNFLNRPLSLPRKAVSPDEESSWSSMTLESESSDSSSPMASCGNFPEVLKSILSDDTNSDSITWIPNGRSFTIKNRDSFSSKILPRYFGTQTKFTTFTRKLSRWGFERAWEGNQTVYRHRFFRREDALLHCTVQNRGSKICDSSSRKTTEKRSVPLKKRPVDESLFQKAASAHKDFPSLSQIPHTVPNRASPVNDVSRIPSAKNVPSLSELKAAFKKQFGGCVLDAPVANTQYSRKPASTEEVMNEAVRVLLRGSSLRTSSALLHREPPSLDSINQQRHQDASFNGHRFVLRPNHNPSDMCGGRYL